MSSRHRAGSVGDCVSSSASPRSRAALAAPSPAPAAQHLGDRTLHRGRPRPRRAGAAGLPHARRLLRTPIAGDLRPADAAQRQALPARARLDGRRHRRPGRTRRAAQGRRPPRGRPAPRAGRRRRAAPRRPHVKKGMTGQDVRVLQDYLTRAGVPTPVDGIFGPGDAATTCKRFQRAQGLTARRRRRAAGGRCAAQHRRGRRRGDRRRRAGAGPSARACAATARPSRRQTRRRSSRP